MRDLDPETIANDPVLRAIARRVDELESELGRQEVEREDWLRSEETRRLYGLA